MSYNALEISRTPPFHSNTQAVNSRTASGLHAVPLERGEPILFVTSELADFVKVGGLGDVSAALPRALLNHYDMRVLMPAYTEVVESLWPIQTIAELPGLGHIPGCTLGRIDLPEGLRVYVLVCPELYERPGSPYLDPEGRDWPDNHIRFARLSLAAAQMAAMTADERFEDEGWHPALLHLHDWQAGLAPAYLRWQGDETPCVYTIHNLAYQGLFDPAIAPDIGVPEHAINDHGITFYDRLSFMKSGIIYSDHITTVSETYAKEITTPAFGCGLENLLAQCHSDGRLSGIANGIDDSWDPKTDAYLACAFATNDWAGKRANTDHVRRMFRLAVSHGPLFAVVSRLVHQKGLDLTIAAAESIVRAGGQLVVIGCGEPAIEEALRNLEARFPGAIGVYIGFSEREARCIFAGSDFLLMPSRFEPCGLSQMYAQRFGALPVAHRTGGLADTIDDGVTGFLFDELDQSAYQHAIDRAFRVYGCTELFYAMRRAAMAIYYQWRLSVTPYRRLYHQLMADTPHRLGKVAP
ncbi:glycogen synthase GlgA [Larsenimonas suaedae]|uniref:Glycogen synthase n=1 Tax=Larsenimonas suaedae TaxID=1851019 RepID=A0ABU1GTF6_9GAMM|nr:glycogen synthase GlgA [Larsenimonas suaedae]MCM2971761.1 glycogen synthase GlgA [Larsenimonas suaedae]MDR5895313.1 glycogen synthase GlgA [Larsenimonas suaedae]